MANFNKVVLLGRLTRDPEVRSFANGGKVAKIGLVVNDRTKKNGQWEDVPMFIDAEVFNRGEQGKSADFVENYLHKGSQVLVEGKLVLDQWDDKATGQKRSKHKIAAFAIHSVDKLEKQGSASAPTDSDVPADESGLYTPGSGGDEIPF